MSKANKHVGIHARRLASDTRGREKAFAEQWEKENQMYHVLDSLLQSPDYFPSELLNYKQEKETPFVPATERDKEVAATVVQWLGSNVGIAFVMDALTACGYEVRQKFDE